MNLSFLFTALANSVINIPDVLDAKTADSLQISSNFENTFFFKSTLSGTASIIKSAIATIEKEYVLTTLGKLGKSDQEYLDRLLERLCCSHGSKE